MLADYVHRPSDDKRDQLVEFWLPAIERFAQHHARRLRIPDPDNAACNCIEHYVLKVLPAYDGRRIFDAWWRHCIARKLINLGRRPSLPAHPLVNCIDLVASVCTLRGTNFRKPARGLSKRPAPTMSGASYSPQGHTTR